MSAETGGKMTLGQKVRMGFLVLVVVLALLLAANNWGSVPVTWFPFVQPVQLPVTLICVFMFGLGSAVTFVWISFRTLRKKKEEPATLPPAAPPAP